LFEQKSQARLGFLARTKNHKKLRSSFDLSESNPLSGSRAQRVILPSLPQFQIYLNQTAQDHERSE
jgi:hypothetical protein